MKVTISHEFNTDPETFWTKIFLDPEFNRALYREGLQFPGYEVLEETDRGKDVFRRVRITPKHEVPAAVQKIVGTSVSYVEEGTFDKTARRYRYRVIPGTMADKFKSEGELRAEPIGPKKMRRVVDMNIEVKVFGVGGMVESFISKSTQETFVKAAEFTNEWIAKKGL